MNLERKSSELLVSIIVLDWNGNIDECREALISAINQDYLNKEVLFVDNGSETNTFNLLRSEYRDILFLRTGVNLGCPGGRNWAADRAKGDILIFLENDGYWKGEKVVQAIVDYFIKYELLGILYTSVRGPKKQKKDPPSDGLKTFGHEVDSLSSLFRGGASAIRKSVFNKCGAFPDFFFRQGEEEWLSYKVYDKGYYILYVPSLEMIHHGSNYLGKRDIITFNNIKNRLITKIRLFPFVDAVIAVVPRLLFRLLYFLLLWRISDAKKLICAVFEAIDSRNNEEIISKSTLKKVRKIRHSQGSDVLNYSCMSVVKNGSTD